MNLCTLTTLQSWMPTMDTGQLFLIRNQAYSQPSTAPLEDTVSCIFPLALSVLRTPEEGRPDPRRVSRMHWNHR